MPRSLRSPTLRCTVNSTLHLSLLLTGPALILSCQAAETSPTEARPIEALAPVGTAGSPFAYLLERYDTDGDEGIAPEEYTRHDGQFARWDTNGDGLITEMDWTDQPAQVGSQIKVMQRMDVLGRYFQTDENGPEVLTLDELANAFFEYDGAGTPDEKLSEAEFRAGAEERALEMPGDGSMMGQSYLGEADGWARLTQHYDTDRDEVLSMDELSTIFIEQDVYELRFDQVRFDDRAAGMHFEPLSYESGLVVGSAVPAVTLTALRGGPSVDLAEIAGDQPIALIFGSYT
ncbi:MAG: hypothetical protein ACI8X5_001883 [Planctomycetota bacterium]|jgi:hypothetical protein